MRAGGLQPEKRFFAVSSGIGFHIQGHLKGLPRRSPLGVSATHPNPAWHPKESSLRPPVPPLLHLFLQTCTRPSREPQGGFGVPTGWLPDGLRVASGWPRGQPGTLFRPLHRKQRRTRETNLSGSTTNTYEEIHYVSVVTADSYAINTGCTTGYHQSITRAPSGKVPSSAGHRSSKWCFSACGCHEGGDTVSKWCFLRRGNGLAESP